VTDVVNQECLVLIDRFKGGIVGEGHSWVAAATPAAAADSPPVMKQPQQQQQWAQFVELPASRAEVPAAPAGTSLASAADLEAKILELAGRYIPDVDPHQHLAAQGLDSLAALELRQKIQEVTGLELMVLIEDPEGATVAAIVAEAAAALATAAPAPAAAPIGSSNSAGVSASIQQPVDVQRRSMAAAADPLWVSPAPVSVKMRIFCLSYAGGVSENVFAR
jgi:aryl carrier-like protein